jgi:hypothetical protein
MMTDSAWQTRLMGLLGIADLPADNPLSLAQRKELLGRAQQSDADPLVKCFAAGTLELLNMPAATQPSVVQPTDRPQEPGPQ